MIDCYNVATVLMNSVKQYGQLVTWHHEETLYLTLRINLIITKPVIEPSQNLLNYFSKKKGKPSLRVHSKKRKGKSAINPREYKEGGWMGMIPPPLRGFSEFFVRRSNINTWRFRWLFVYPSHVFWYKSRDDQVLRSQDSTS